MGKDLSKFRRLSVHIVFCLCVIIFFGRNTVLRMPASNAIYKEYLTGLFALALFYGNTYVFFPRLFLTRSWFAYLCVVALSLIAATCAELALVYPQIKPLVIVVFEPTAVNRVLFTYWSMILLRNTGFILLSFALCNIRYQTQMKEKYEARLREKNQEVGTQTIGEVSEFVIVQDILYCQQAKNVTWMILDGGRIVTRYSSLKKMGQLIGEEHIIEVSKSLFVMREKIQCYNENAVSILDSVKGELHSFTWSEIFYNRAISKLTDSPQGNSSDLEEKDSKGETKDTKSHLENRKQLSDYFKRHPNARQVYSYIHRHPGCKANQMAAKLSVSEGSLNRILAQLKQDGLIEYVGSKKTGGYQVTIRPRPAEEPKQQSV